MCNTLASLWSHRSAKEKNTIKGEERELPDTAGQIKHLWKSGSLITYAWSNKRRGPYKLGKVNKNWDAISKSYNGHSAAYNSDFSKLVESKLQSDAQEIMQSIGGCKQI